MKVYTEPVDHDHGPGWGLEDTELALWRCYGATGADISDGPIGDWKGEAVEEVGQMREERDRLADALDAIRDRLRKVEDIL